MLRSRTFVQQKRGFSSVSARGGESEEHARLDAAVKQLALRKAVQ
jgi:hypothetical protein